MTRIKLLLLLSLLFCAPLHAATPTEPAPKSSLPPIEQFKQDMQQSRLGFGLTFKNARFYAGWIPRGFISAMLRYRRDLLPGEPLSQEQWKKGPYFREGMKYLPGITRWGASYMARRHDQRKALEAANWDFSGTASVGFGRFLGFAFDPAAIMLLIGGFSLIRRMRRNRRQRNTELAMMREDHRHRGGYAAFPPMPMDHRPPEEPRFDDAPPPDSAMPAPPTTASAAPQPELAPSFSATSHGPDRLAAEQQAEPAAAEAAAENAFTAFEACRGKAEAGAAEQQFQLGTMFRRGVGVNASARQARHWFHLAAEQGHPQAQYELARQLFHGIGTLPDEHAAALWMEQAASRGIIDAKLNLATLYARGIGVRADATTAQYWLRQAADEHDSDAAELMASACEHGWLGLDRDTKAAAAWRQAAARH